MLLGGEDSEVGVGKVENSPDSTCPVSECSKNSPARHHDAAMATATGAKKARKTQQQTGLTGDKKRKRLDPTNLAAAVVCADNERNFPVSASELKAKYGR